MRHILRIIFSIALSFVFLLFSIKLPLASYNTFAQGEFQTNYKVSYLIDTNGKTDVIQEITLKNKTANYYADKFELKIGSVKAENVQAKDATGPLETSVKFENNTTTIAVRFNQRVIGIDKSLTWTLTYQTGEIATKSGQIWEISIPRLAKSPEIENYEAKISVPTTFGEMAFSVPQPHIFSKQGLKNEFTFSKEQLFESGISMSFGKNQVFSFDLKYHLENNNFTNQYGYITLPPDNNYQKVVLEKINPEPLNVTVDQDGNFLAKYKLAPKDQIDISVQGYTEVFSKPFRKIENQLSDQDKEYYTQPQQYWETDNALIKDKAKELKTPQKIYNFVADFLTYSQDRLNQPKIERKGAAQAINSPKDSVCMEFTDLFIAIARSAGIPAREVEGYAYTQNERLKPLSLGLLGGDILHAWPEYWDDNLGWVQVDPTWGSTSGGLDYFNKLDFNHITFIQKGISSTKPYPPGTYKRSNNINERNVFVSFAKDLPTPSSTPVLSLNIPKKILSGIPAKVIVTVQNNGSTSIIGQKLALSSTKLENQSKTKKPIAANEDYAFAEIIPILPPFSSKNFEVTLESKGLFSNSKDTVVLNYADAQISKPIEILALNKIVFQPMFASSIAVSFSIIALGFILYRKFSKKNSKNTPR